MRRSLIVALVALAFPASAAASPQAPTVAEALAIAERAFPWSPCAGQLSATYDVTLRGRGRDGEVVHDGGCDMRIAPELDVAPQRRCDVIVHESGHRAGLGHAAFGVMHVSTEPWPPCHVLPSPRVQALESIQELLPGPRAWWTVQCGRVHRMTCRATGRRAKLPRRFRVTVLRTMAVEVEEL